MVIIKRYLRNLCYFVAYNIEFIQNNINVRVEKNNNNLFANILSTSTFLLILEPYHKRFIPKRNYLLEPMPALCPYVTSFVQSCIVRGIHDIEFFFQTQTTFPCDRVV